MENNELFQTIERLKNTLSAVASARQQVNDVVSAYSQTNTSINSYVENFERIEVAISAVIELLSNNKAVIAQQATSIVNEFKQNSTSIVGDIKKELSTSTKQFKNETSRHIVNMTRLIESLETVVDNASQLTSIVEITSDSADKIVDSFNATKQELNTSHKIQYEAIKQIDDTQILLSHEIQSINTLLSNITKSLIEQEKQLVTILTSISHTQQSIDSLKKIVEDNSAHISKENKINRWLLILCFIILVIIHFV